MFSTRVTNETSQDKRITFAREELVDFLNDGRLYLTPMFMLDEPWRTVAFQALDGHRLNNSVPQPGSDLPIELKPIRIVSVERSGTVELKKNVLERIPGTNKNRLVVKRVKLGNDVTVSPNDARWILRKHGWPIQQHRSNGARIGTVVEVEWLRHEASLPDALDDVRALWAEVSARIGEPEPKPIPQKGRAQASL